MSVARLISVSMIVAFPVACVSDRIPGPSSGLSYAAATPACGPTDGPAVAIYLARAPVAALAPAAPYVRVHIWQPPDRLTERQWMLYDHGQDGGAWRHGTATDYEIATSGKVTVNAVHPDTAMEGFVDLTFPSAGRIRQEFRAVWLSRSVACG